MRFDTKNLSLDCAKILITYIGPFVDPNIVHSQITSDYVKELNTFLNAIYHILNPKNKYTLSNYELRGKYLLAFSKLYQHLSLNKECQLSFNSLIGPGKSWTQFLCSTTKRVVPFVHIYKVLSMLGLIKANCYQDAFYIKNTANKNSEPVWLNLSSIFDNLYNPNLRFSKTRSKLCLEKLSPVIVSEINDYIYTSFFIRQHYLEHEYCGTIIHLKSDKEHEQFITCIQELLDALQKHKKSNISKL